MIRRRLGRPVRTGPAADHSVEPGPSHSIFLRGLSLGALVGAAIAGSAIWERRRIRRTGGPTSEVTEGSNEEPGTD